MSFEGNETIKHLDSEEDKREVIDLYQKFQFFMLFYSVLYSIVITAKIMWIKRNTGSKLIYIFSIILLCFRLLEIVMNTLLKNPFNIVFSVFLYWTTGVLMLTSYAFIKTRYVKSENDTKYTGFRNEMIEVGIYMKRHKKLSFGNALWCVFILILFILLKIPKVAPFAFIAGNVASIALFFFTALKYFRISNNEEISDQIKKVIDILTTCLVVMGAVDFISMISMPTFIRYFVVLQGAFYLAELLLVSYIPMMTTNEKQL